MNSGVATCLREIYAWIVNLHCTAHRLINVIIGKLAKKVLTSAISVLLKRLHACLGQTKQMLCLR